MVTKPAMKIRKGAGTGKGREAWGIPPRAKGGLRWRAGFPDSRRCADAGLPTRAAQRYSGHCEPASGDLKSVGGVRAMRQAWHHAAHT
jgi:hypothetical protein